MRKAALLLSLFCLSAFSQNNLLTLQIKTDDVPSVHGFSYWQKIKIVSKDTSITCRLHAANPDEIKGLKPGTYKIAILSVFNHNISKKIEVNKKTPLVKFTGLGAFYSKSKTDINLSEKLKLNDTLFVIYSNTQNDTIREKIGVTRTKDGLMAIEYKGLSNEILQYMFINETTYKFVVSFENHCKKNSSPKAETAPAAEVYTIELNKALNTYVVPGDWKGIDRLKAPLFVVQKK